MARPPATRAFLADTFAGGSHSLITYTNEQATLVSAHIRAELVRLGRVEERGALLGSSSRRDARTSKSGARGLLSWRMSRWSARIGL